MIDPDHPLDKKKEELERLIKLAKSEVEKAQLPNKDDKPSLEQQQLEGERGSDEKALDDLKVAVESLAIAVQHIDTRARELENDRQEQLLDMRETYARKAYRFVWLWSVALIIILILQGSNAPDVHIFFLEFKAHDFDLSDKVLITLISGVTVNIVAVFVVVIRNLFPAYTKTNVKPKKNKTERD
ncbi:hypothetical protein ZQ65_15210 [Salmonella enterica subsp. enterica serovar Newport]|uniref:Uncharacterized protein n=1 Tax=Salmonella newport TaxID=108619 RepID=A0A5U9KU90_SALNE|nr:hypothetical protein [Salmonella enterica subsp. enterica serovar Newport]ECN8541089.1 hypothetical protein [Salmonella enterica subsp. enterica serovar Newport]